MSEQAQVPAAQDAGIFAGPVSWAALRAAHRNVRKSVRVPMRADLVDEMAVLEEQMRREDKIDEWENRPEGPVAPKIARQIQELEAQVHDSEVLFQFESLGRGEVAKLQAQHPATEEIKAQFGTDDLEWHPETFPPALMAACCIEPADLRGNVAAWEEIHSTWSSGQVMPLWGACLAVNFMGADVPKSVLASEILRRNGSASSSTTAPP